MTREEWTDEQKLASVIRGLLYNRLLIRYQSDEAGYYVLNCWITGAPIPTNRYSLGHALTQVYRRVRNTLVPAQLQVDNLRFTRQRLNHAKHVHSPLEW